MLRPHLDRRNLIDFDPQPCGPRVAADRLDVPDSVDQAPGDPLQFPDLDSVWAAMKPLAIVRAASG